MTTTGNLRISEKPLTAPEAESERAYWERTKTREFKRDVATRALDAASLLVTSILKAGIEKWTEKEAIAKIIEHQVALYKVSVNLPENEDGNHGQ